ncbi:MarR family winged helix-turn-helix transcriptional regulator [Allokutzneria oryzae]|uniref:MarR family winged helix-turn-helix transcriptional regulator n=1 Tax=Allokutzneria oryzae TaxID=1378989 RepID=A0ABV6A8R8_9PSEU
MAKAEPCAQPDPANNRLGNTVVWLLGRASLRASQSLHERLAGHGIRKWHYAVLAVVAEAGPITQAEIVRRLGIDRGDLVGVLNDLGDAGYVRRAPDPANRRRNQVTLTPEGAAALRRFDACVVETDDSLLGVLSAAEREQLTRLLERVVHAAN